MIFKIKDKGVKLPEPRVFLVKYVDKEAGVLLRKVCPWCNEARMVRQDMIEFEEGLHQSVCRARNREIIRVHG